MGTMSRTDLSKECGELQEIINALINGEETCEIRDEKFSLQDVIDYLNGFLSELIKLNEDLIKHGNTPELLDKVHDKYSELWLFQVSFYIKSLPRVIGGLMIYPSCNE